MIPTIRRALQYKTKDFVRALSNSSSKKCILFDSYNDLRLISINRPHKRNSLNIETICQLKDALNEFDNDPTVSVGILYGENGNFCSGFDIDEILEKGYDPLIETCAGLREGPICKKPIIAAVDGYAAGEGFELALACDMRVVEDTATLGFLGKRFGAPTLMGGVERLTDLVGAARALALLCSGFQINGVTADTWGLASRLVSTGTCVGQAVSLATTVAKYPQNAVIHDKLLVYEHLLKGNKMVANSKIELIETLGHNAIEDVNQMAEKFKEGIGKHGSFRNIKVRQIPQWEKEDEQFDKS